MIKKGMVLAVLSIVAANTLTACGSNNRMPVMNPQPVIAQNVQSNSILGVSKEIKKAATLAFEQMDADKNQIVSPQEFGLETPDHARAYYALDKNKDGLLSKSELIPNFFETVGLTVRIKKTADFLFQRVDRNYDKYVTPEELNSSLVSPRLNELFAQFDTGKKDKGKLSKSEFENLFAHVAETDRRQYKK